MQDSAASSLTALIQAWSEDRTGAEGALADRVYRELHQIAGAYLTRESRPRLEPAELVHEAWLRMKDCRGQFPSRHHFYAFAALQMRRLLIECARAANGPQRHCTLVSLSPAMPDEQARPVELAMFGQALEILEQLDERKSKAFALSELAGFTQPEVAEMLEVSCATIERDLRFVRSWIAARLT